MIKTNELMLGDLVRLTNGKIGRVVSLNEYGENSTNSAIVVEYEQEYSYGRANVSEAEVDPIPLTEEFLFEFGFKEFGEDMLELTITWNSGIFYARRVNSFNYKHMERGVAISNFVTKVHQFQHFLRHCGLSEFAENLKENHYGTELPD